MFLFIDSSQSNRLIVALVKRREILDRIILPIHQNHSEKLLPTIEEILKKNKLVLKDLCGIGVIRGPGSFTGVRVAVACANALGFSLNIAVKGVKYQEGVNLIKLLFWEFKGGTFSKPVVPFYQYKAV